MDLSVVVCTFNRCELLNGVLDTLVRQETESVDYEVIVVDNNSTDRTPEVVEAYRQLGRYSIRRVEETVQGLGAARDRGLREASGNIILYIDDDCFAATDWVQQMARAHTEWPEVPMIGGTVTLRWEQGWPWWVENPDWTLLGHYEPGTLPVLNPCPLPFGANLSFKKAVLAEIGGFRTDYGPKAGLPVGAEDLECALRLQRAGFPVLFYPGAKVEHRLFRDEVTLGYLVRFCFARGRGDYLIHNEFGQVEASGRRSRYVASYLKCCLSVVVNALSVYPKRSLRAGLDSVRALGCLYESLRTG